MTIAVRVTGDSWWGMSRRPFGAVTAMRIRIGLPCTINKDFGRLEARLVHHFLAAIHKIYQIQPFESVLAGILQQVQDHVGAK